ncbi:NAD(P)-dependent oxidoreductase [Halodesulfovibrio aestuarii]|uniref:3-hydroxyisobutyrate dehydrogenase n=1 Tax=Halodesulfovibrio aestuarii TaxID=126333 RepID=A0A8G2CAF9_9BACT|nr:NAD(P)-dependent oxidoreductase [Halodesulfovibrio aestuarii]SHJ30628.1 3-hydroxyisobutyrate dehydrogenase [Halodesulfovibrio aestuarii]
MSITSKRIGWIGTGVMGKSMCKHLITSGCTAFVYNRSAEKTKELTELGATLCSSPAEVAANSDVVFTIVGFPQDVEEVILGENGVIANAKEGTIIVDMTTSTPSLAKRIAEVAASKSMAALDAPVSGGDLGAREGTLAIMVGGDLATYETVLPLFEMMGKNVQRMGESGAGQHCKMANQILIAGTMIGTVESLLYAAKAGMDLDQVIDVIGSGAAGSWSINNLGRRIAKKDFDPGFFIKHFVKDMGIALEEAAKMNLALPGLAMANQFYVAAKAQGLENLGTQGLYKVFETMNQA